VICHRLGARSVVPMTADEVTKLTADEFGW
jgi:hypothetical protein